MSSVSVPKLDAGHRAASPVPRPVSKNFAPAGTAVWPPSLHFDMETQIELGLDSFGDVTRENGQPLPHAQVLRNVVAEAVLADQLGIYFIGLASTIARTSRSRRRRSCWRRSPDKRAGSSSVPPSPF